MKTRIDAINLALLPQSSTQVQEPKNPHGTIVSAYDEDKERVQISYSEPSESTESNLGIQSYAPVPDEDDVTLNNIDNISEFPCEMSLSNL